LTNNPTKGPDESRIERSVVKAEVKLKLESVRAALAEHCDRRRVRVMTKPPPRLLERTEVPGEVSWAESTSSDINNFHAPLVATAASAGGGGKGGGGMGNHGHGHGHGHWGGGFGGGVVVIAPSCWRWIPGVGKVWVCK
jgi:hypothetical protein